MSRQAQARRPLRSRALSLLSTGQALAGARLGVRTPLKVTHLLTYRCNTTCHFCTRINIPSEELDLEQIKQMMSSFAEMGTRWWVFNGGEALLRKEIGDIVSHGRQLGFNLTMVSNGTLLKKRFDAVRQLDLLICSIHGDEEEHDRVVGKKGAFRLAMEGIRLLRAEGVQVCLMVVLNDRNRALMEELLELGESLGCGVAFQPVVPTRLGGTEIDHDLMPRVAAMREAVDWLVDQKMQGRPVSASRSYLEAVAEAWPDRPFGVKCWAGKLYCEVTPEGYVTSCCSEEEYTFAECYGPSVGWRRAFLSLPDRSRCQACYFKGPQELNLLMGLRPRQAMRAVSNLARGRVLWD